jgi:atypical dual specificity phosphatase
MGARLFLLDMLLGNPDRLPCEALGWRGNPHNILFAVAGARAGRMVAIDSAVQRRPPGAQLPKMLLQAFCCAAHASTAGAL